MVLLLSVGAPRVCGDDPRHVNLIVAYTWVLPAYAGMIQLENALKSLEKYVLPAYAGMIPLSIQCTLCTMLCSPRMRG